MRTGTLSAAIAGLLLFGACTAVTGTSGDTAMAAENPAHVHIGHVMTGWNDTPEGKGLLPTAEAEAAIAIQHARFAASRPDDLDWMKLHTGHVMNACDPTVEPQGPGLGYGVVKAASGVAQHIRFAAESEGASDNVKTHAVHVATSAGNVVERCRRILELGARVKAAESAAQAAPLVAEIERLAKALVDGEDADGDGTVTWKQGEGGLAEVRKHMGFMLEGEGLAG